MQTTVNDYFARKNGDALAEELNKRRDSYQRHLEETGRLKLIQEAYKQHYNLKLGNLITKSGSQGEIVNISANLFRSYVNNIHVLVAQTKPSFKCLASDGSNEALSQCILGDAAMGHFLAEGGLEAQIVEMPLLAQIFGDVWLEVDWSEEEGYVVAVDPETNEPVYSGAPLTKLHTGVNVTRDINLRDGDAFKWVIVDSWENKWSLAAHYSKHADHILNSGSDDKKKIFGDGIYADLRKSHDGNGDLIQVSRFYHIPLKGVLPQGKEALMISGKIIDALPLTKHYRQRLPVVRMAAGKMEGTCLPYSGAWDLLPLCQASNALLTAATSNAVNLALSSFWTPPTTEGQFSITQLRGGFTHIKSPVKPEPLSLAHNSPEIWNTMNQLERLGQLMTGLNSVARGDLASASQLKSGTAIATVLASAVQFQHRLQSNWKEAAEEVMNVFLEVLQVNATQPLLISISKSTGKSYQKAFTAKDIASVKRVRAEIQNPVLATYAGKLDLAKTLLESFPDQMDSSKYLNVVKTGDLTQLENGQFDRNMVLLQESEALRAHKKITPLLIERHDLHIINALELIATPDAKEDAELVEAVQDYVLERLDKWNELMNYPQLVALTGIAPPPGWVDPNAVPPQMPQGAPAMVGSPNNPAAAQLSEGARPSSLPPNADPGLMAAYEGSQVGQLAPKPMM